MRYKHCRWFLLYSFLCGSVAWGAEADVVENATLSMSIRDCLLMVLENNRSLSVERYEPEIYETFIDERGSIFDPSLDGEINASDTTGQRTSGVGDFRQVESQTREMDVTVSKKLPLGLEMDAGFNTERRSSNVYRKLYSTRIGASLVMPVLEGYGTEVNLAGVKIAETDVDISRYELQGFVNALLFNAEDIYWDIQLAHEELAIQNASLDLAKQQFAETKDRIDVGALGEIELSAAEGEVAMRESAVVDAQIALKTKELELIRALNPGSGRPWELHLQLSDTPATNPPQFSGSTEDCVLIALDNRPELRQAQLEIDKNEIELVRTKNGLLPQLDFFVTLGHTGFARSFYDSVESMVKDDNYDVSGGFLFQVPLGNLADKARHKRTNLYKEQAEEALFNLEQLIELDVRTALLEVERTTRQIDLTRRAARLKEDQYQAELEKFKVGRSTNLLVLVARRDLIEARLDAVRAQIERRKALANLTYVEGTTLDRHRIVLPAR